MAGERPTATPSKARLPMSLDIRIARPLGRRAGMGDGAVARRSHLLGVFPYISRGDFRLPRLPRLGPRVEFSLAELDLESALDGIECDDVAVAQKRDRAAHGGFGTDVADAEAAGRSGEAPIGDERDLATHALPVKGGGGRQHLSHPGAAFGPFVADYEHVTFLVLLLLDGLEARFLPVKAARRAGKLQVRHPSNLHNGAVRREVALEPDDAAGGGERLVGGTDHVLVLIPLHSLEVLGDRAPSHGQAFAVKIPVVEQRPHQEWNAACFEYIFGNKTTARFQIRDVWCPFEDFGDVEEVELHAAFVGDRG